MSKNTILTAEEFLFKDESEEITTTTFMDLKQNYE